MKTVMLVFGTRPEAIKMAPLVKEFQKYPDAFRTVVTVTGQHRQMLDQVLDVFQINPDYDLDIMKLGQDLTDISVMVLSGLKNLFLTDKPDILLVHGDTSTSTSAALAAFYHHIPVGHIEAGLRTNNLSNPWPEEANRQITSRISNWHFAPTELNRQNLLAENISNDSIIVTGNTVIDALQTVTKALDINARLHTIKDSIRMSGYDIDRLNEKSRRLIVITAHRRENIGDGLDNICNAIKSLSKMYPDVDFVCTMHLNPVVRGQIKQIYASEIPDNLFFVEPLEYFAFVYLMSKSYIILTDSGGIQEEAPGIGIPVLVMRNATERPEAIDAGTVKLVGTDPNVIINTVSKLLDCPAAYQEMKHVVNPYGDGNASKRIVDYFMSISD